MMCTVSAKVRNKMETREKQPSVFLDICNGKSYFVDFLFMLLSVINAEPVW